MFTEQRWSVWQQKVIGRMHVLMEGGATFNYLRKLAVLNRLPHRPDPIHLQYVYKLPIAPSKFRPPSL
jgi:hypothetical protein